MSRSDAILAAATAGLKGRLDVEQLQAARDGVARLADQQPAPPTAEAPKAIGNGAAPVTKAQFRNYTDNLEDALKRAIAMVIANERGAAAMRFTEVERRCADLEARLAALESRGGAE